ncbi:MAG: MBL fold metallo-hydrolase [Acidobacteria bacterium]|nr:MBL fold metallo-hydrolase [Acidobacteriota bacterium]
MARRVWLPLSLAVVVVAVAGAQDARGVLQTAAAAMGASNMTSIQYTGTGWQGMVGQNVAPDQDWPRVDLTSYTRTIDFDTMSSREEYARVQGSNPARGGGAGFPFLTEQRVVNLVSGNYAWTLNAQGQPVPQPDAAELRRLEIFLTPWGFLKGAMAPGANPTLVTRNEYGGRASVVSFMAFGKYRVNGTINAQNLVQRVQTWVPNPVVGDLYYENVYTNYRDMNGVKVPRFHQHQDYDDGGNEPNVSGGDHAFGLETVSALRVNVAGAALTVPNEVRSATVPPVRVQSQKLGDGVWLVGGGSHNSVAVEFGDHVAVIEAPLNEERSLAVIGEVNRLIPGKPIRFVVNTHHHWDHLGGIRTYVHEGATIVTHVGNRPYYQEVLRARPWLLQPDRLSLYPPEEWSEGYIFETVREKYILGDSTRTVELYTVQGLAHAVGMLMVYIPKEKIVVQADLYNPQAPAPNASTRTFNQNLQRLKLDVATIVGIHGNPAPMAQFVQTMSRAQ